MRIYFSNANLFLKCGFVFKMRICFSNVDLFLICLSNTDLFLKCLSNADLFLKCTFVSQMHHLFLKCTFVCQMQNCFLNVDFLIWMRQTNNKQTNLPVPPTNKNCWQTYRCHLIVTSSIVP